MRALSVAEINKRLHDRFKLLTRGGRVLLPRQQTLRALRRLVIRLVAGERTAAARGGYASSSEGSTSPRSKESAAPSHSSPRTFSMS